MTPVVKVDVIMPYITDLPRDVAINTFHIQCETLDDDTRDAIFLALDRFYNEVQATGFALGSYLSAYIQRGVGSSRMVAYLTPELPTHGARHYGSPIGENAWTLHGAGTDESLPFEVALCSSYRSNFSLIPKGRQRGRIYLGPLSFDTINPNADSPSRPTDDFADTLRQASAGLRDSAGLATAAAQWGVWSNGSTIAPDTIAQFFPITDGWVDNEWDTQRRRGTEANIRGVW